MHWPKWWNVQSLKSHLPSVWRVTLAVFGGFFFTLLLTSSGAKISVHWFNAAPAPVFIWFMLLGFVVYCTLVMWMIATRHLVRSSGILLTSIAVMWFWVGSGGVLV